MYMYVCVLKLITIDLYHIHFIFYQHTSTDQPTSNNKPFAGRKTWEQSTPFKKQGLQPQYQSVPYKVVESGRDTLSSEVASCQQYESTLASPRRLFSSATPDVTKALTSSGRGQDLSATG